MPPIPPDQRSPYGTPAAAAAKRGKEPDETAKEHQRQGDRASGDDDSAADDDGATDDDGEAERLKAERREAELAERRSRLAQFGFPIFIRFDDLVAAGIVESWTSLGRMVGEQGFPVGVRLSHNVRAWRVDEVEAWLAERPSARKAVSPDAVHPRVRDKRRAAAEAQP